MKVDSTTIKAKKLARVVRSGDASGINPAHLSRLVDVLFELRAARSVRDIPAELKLHQLEFSKGRRMSPEKIQWSIRVSAQWRLVFRIEKENTVSDLDYVQYH